MQQPRHVSYSLPQQVVSNLTPLLVVLCMFSFEAVADDTRGRLPDGRAFRTDAQGLQLVDYTAELEVAIETLNRRIESLESELKDRGQTGAKGTLPRETAEWREQTLASNTQAPQQCPRVSCPPTPQLTCPESDCTSEVEEARSAVRAELTAVASNRDEAVVAYKQALDRQAIRTKSLSEKVSLQSQELAQQATALEAAQKQLASLQQTNASLSAELSRRAAERSVQVAAIPQVAPPRAVEVEPVAAPIERLDPRAALSLARLQAVDSVRGTVTREMNELSALLATRSSTYYNRKNRNGPVSFTLQPPRSRDGRTLAMLREEIGEATQMRELAALRSEIQAMKSAIQDDIAFIQRMDRSAQR